MAREAQAGWKTGCGERMGTGEDSAEGEADDAADSGDTVVEVADAGESEGEA